MFEPLAWFQLNVKMSHSPVPSPERVTHLYNSEVGEVSHTPASRLSRQSSATDSIAWSDIIERQSGLHKKNSESLVELADRVSQTPVRKVCCGIRIESWLWFGHDCFLFASREHRP